MWLRYPGDGLRDQGGKLGPVQTCPACRDTAQHGWLPPSTEQPQGVGRGEFCQGSDYMRVNLSKNSKLSLKKKKKRLHSALPWAYVNSSHSQTSRNVWGGKLFSSSEACLAPSRTAPTCNECAPGPLCTTYQADTCEPLPRKRTALYICIHLDTVITTTERQASLTGLLCWEGLGLSTLHMLHGSCSRTPFVVPLSLIDAIKTFQFIRR